jgi:hypothetical protein
MRDNWIGYGYVIKGWFWQKMGAGLVIVEARVKEYFDVVPLHGD